MGTSFGTPRVVEPADSDPTTALPPPYYLQSLWQVTCRPCSKQNAFNGPNPLLIQPDARLFCVKGLRCRQFALAQAEKAVAGASPLWQPSPAVAAAQRHCEIYLHASKATIVQEARAASTAVANAPALTVEPIPHCKRCWAMPAFAEKGRASRSLDNSALTFPLLPDSFRFLGGPQEQVRTAVVYIHGFRKRYFPAMGEVRHIHTRLAEQLRLRHCRTGTSDARGAPKTGGGRGGGGRGGSDEDVLAAAGVAVVSFLWPAHHNTTSYGRARAKANGPAAERLLATLRALRADATDGGQGNDGGGFHRVVVVGHSMGCRLALTACVLDKSLRSKEEEEEEEEEEKEKGEAAAAGGAAAAAPPPPAKHRALSRPAPLADALVLLAGAVPATTLSESPVAGCFAPSRLSCGDGGVVVCHSQRDATLGTPFQLVETGEALGRVGCALENRSDSSSSSSSLRGECVDATESVAGHHPHLWIASDAVMKRIAHAVWPREPWEERQPTGGSGSGSGSSTANANPSNVAAAAAATSDSAPLELPPCRPPALGNITSASFDSAGLDEPSDSDNDTEEEEGGDGYVDGGA